MQRKRSQTSMHRRQFFLSVFALSSLWPLAALPQNKPLRVGMVWPGHGSFGFLADAFINRMRTNGFEENRNVVYDWVKISSFANSELERGYQSVVARNADIIFAGGPGNSVRIAARSSATIPIVMASPDLDPVASGLAESYRSPGGNLTGIYSVQSELTAKRMELFREALPDVHSITVFWDRHSEEQWQDTPRIAKGFGFNVFGVKYDHPPYDFERGFADVPAEHRRGLLILASPGFNFPERKTLPEFALRHKIPTMFVIRNYVLEGGLLSYGVNFPRIWERAADYIAKISKGAQPENLPIAQPDYFDLSINLSTASKLGLELPPSLLFRATEIIE